MYRVRIETKYDNNIDFVTDNVEDERVQEILQQEWVVSYDITPINEEEILKENVKRLTFAPKELKKKCHSK